MKKLLWLIIFLFPLAAGTVFAVDYLYYADGCESCQEIVDFVDDHKLQEQFDIEFKEVRHNQDNLKAFGDYLTKHDLAPESTYVPFLVINSGEYCDYMNGKKAIANYYASQLDMDEVCIWWECEPLQCDSALDCDEEFTCQASALLENIEPETSFKEKIKFLGVMLPAALADSVNPCAFAVIILLLFSIISLEKNYKRAIWAWLLFTLAVFISYLLMWIGLFSILSSMQLEAITTIKIIVWALAILIWLFNLKDFLWYGRWFLMEVPISRRPLMQKIIKWVTSPGWAFLIWFVVSLFLLPCTSGPYFVVLGYLASEASSLQAWGYFCLFLYNIIFILPMLFLVLAIGFGRRSAEELWTLRKKYKRHIHLIVAILMFVMAGLVLFGG